MARKKSDIKLESQIEKEIDMPLPAYFLSLTIENVRCFGPTQTLDLSNGNGRPARWTIILGDNGVGKTTLLQSLVALLPVVDSRDLTEDGHETMVVPRYVLDSPLRSEWRPHRHNNQMKPFFTLSAKFFTGVRLNDRAGGSTINDLSFTSSPSKVHLYELVKWKKLRDVVCFAYGATRRMGDTSLSDKIEDDPTASLFSEEVALVNAEEWLLRADYAAIKGSPIQEQAKKRRDQIKDILITLLPDVTDIRFTQLSEAQMKSGIEVETPYGWVSIKDLSLGYKTLIAWMVDLASRLFDKYPDSSNPLAEAAVVLVDEIDLHLHPKWQRSLMGYLTDLFPNTQFIATAHSPLVVQAATDANIAVLRRKGDHVVIDNDVETIRGWRIDQVLTSDLFELKSARPPEFDDSLAERKGVLSKARLTKKDRARLRELDAKIGELPAGETLKDNEAMDIILRAAERLRSGSDIDKSTGS